MAPSKMPRAQVPRGRTAHRLVDGVGVGEGVVHGVPVAELVGDVEVHRPARGRVGDRGRQLHQGNARADETEQLVQRSAAGSPSRMVSARSLVAVPALEPLAALRRWQRIELGVDVVEQGRQVDRVAPARQLFHALGPDHAGYQRRQDGRRLLPADVVEQLEGLVGEVERVALVQIEVVGAGGEDHRRDVCLGEAEADGGAQGALGGVFGAAVDEAAEPVDIALGPRLLGLQWLQVEARRLVLGRARDVDDAVIAEPCGGRQGRARAGRWPWRSGSRGRCSSRRRGS